MKREVNMRLTPDLSKKGIPDTKKTADNIKMQPDGRIITDPFGSWTGISEDDIFDQPIQDVDDL